MKIVTVSLEQVELIFLAVYLNLLEGSKKIDTNLVHRKKNKKYKEITRFMIMKKKN